MDNGSINRAIQADSERSRVYGGYFQDIWVCGVMEHGDRIKETLEIFSYQSRESCRGMRRIQCLSAACLYSSAALQILPL